MNGSVVAVVKSNQIINSLGFSITGIDPLSPHQIILGPKSEARK